MWTYIWIPVGSIKRTIRRRSVAVPWSLFPRELSVGQMVSLSLLWRGYECRTRAVVCASSPQGPSKRRLYTCITNMYVFMCKTITLAETYCVTDCFYIINYVVNNL